MKKCKEETYCIWTVMNENLLRSQFYLWGLKNLCGMHICTLYFWQCSDACQFGPKRNSSCIQTWLENKDTKMSLSNASWLSKLYKACSIFVSTKSTSWNRILVKKLTFHFFYKTWQILSKLCVPQIPN